jgi:transposase-like protein
MRALTTAFLKKFPDDDACWRQLEKVRWPDGPVCAKCGNVGPTMACGRKHYHQCKACNAKFIAAFGTPLKGTHLPMRTCFTALYLLAVSSKGLPSVALGRHLGVGQKTAWFLGHRIRAMMGDKTGLLRRLVQADQTYVGGKRKRAGAIKFETLNIKGMMRNPNLAGSSESRGTPSGLSWCRSLRRELETHGCYHESQ